MIKLDGLGVGSAKNVTLNKMKVCARVLAIALALSVCACDELVKKATSTNRASVTQTSSTPAPPDPALLEKARAIQLAKEGRNLVAGRGYVRLPPPEVLTNDYQIRAQMSQMKGDLNVLGWQAQKWADDTYLVTYTYERGGQSRGWPFEVKLSAGVVRYVIGDPELEEKYGWGTGR
jgi:hypothetical protein